jgi:uncharacterized protein (UPF0210 family)
MRIRSITCFFDPRTRSTYSNLDHLGRLAQTARDLYSKAGLEVQELRLATTPFPFLYPTEEVDSAVRLAQALESDARQRGFAYVSLGPALTSQPESYSLVVPILKATQNVFLSGSMTAPRGDTNQHSEVDLKAVRACAEIIHQASTLSPDGFGNLRFAALANVAPNGPFFPGAFHQGTRPAFALAMECADVAYSAIRKAKNLDEARQSIVTTLEAQGTALTSTANHLAQQFDLDFRGIDFSLAPFPEQWCSLGAALEALGLSALGLSGSLAAAAFLADTLDRGSWMRTGFNGLMMPVLEDSTLAARTGSSNAAGTATYGVHDLLMYSAVCGTGLDTVPLPGDSTPEQIGALLTDVAALALRLNKPLTARLMPIPGKQAGDPTEFTFAFFANGHVLPLPAAPLGGLFANSDTMAIRSRR